MIVTQTHRKTLLYNEANRENGRGNELGNPTFRHQCDLRESENRTYFGNIQQSLRDEIHFTNGLVRFISYVKALEKVSVISYFTSATTRRILRHNSPVFASMNNLVWFGFTCISKVIGIHWIRKLFTGI